jgi:dihydroorotate dehydrogenase electron transfer subunit
MKKKMLQKKLKVILNHKIKGKYFKLCLDSRDIASIAKPGQFLMLGLNRGVFEPLLRRPMSIHYVKNKQIEILYETLGQGTRVLSQKKPGEYLDVLGPLGNGFEISRLDAASIILVAGGMGVAPLLYLAQKLMKRKTQNAKRKTLVLIGAKTKKNILCEKEFKELDCSVKIATDDGTRGFKGKVSDLLKQTLSTIDYRLSTIYACGSTPMLKAVASIASKYKIEARGSFEAHMACGIGACMGCVIRVKDENRYNKEGFVYQRVCKDGPVFGLNQIIWGKE